MFNERLKYIRKYNRDTQERLASSLSINRTTIAKMESGNISPNVETLCKIANVYGVSVDYLVGREEYSRYVWTLVESFNITPEEAKKMLLADSDKDLDNDLENLRHEYSKDALKKHILENLNKFLQDNNYIDIKMLQNVFSSLLDKCNDTSKANELKIIIQTVNQIEEYLGVLNIIMNIPKSSVEHLEKFISELLNSQK